MGALYFPHEAFQLPENLNSLINTKFTSALSTQKIFYSPSSTSYHQGHVFRYHITIVPSFTQKPNVLQSPTTSPSPHSALLDFPPSRIITEAGPFRIVLNKYCAVPNQILLTSLSARSQSEALDASELSAVYRVVTALPCGQVAFYNCGAASGASQPQKHVQVVSLGEEMVDGLFLGRASVEDRTGLNKDPDVPYAHFIVRIKEKCTGDYLKNLYDTLLCATKSALEGQIEEPAYNFIMTTEWLMMIPRTKAMWNGVGVNALGMLGILWLRDDEQRLRWAEVGFDEVLVNVGVRRLEVEV